MHYRFRLANIPFRFVGHHIKDRIDVVRRLIQDVSGTRVLQVNRRCKNFIQELTEGYKYPRPGERRDNDNPIDESNHAVDSFGMWAYVRARR